MIVVIDYAINVMEKKKKPKCDRYEWLYCYNCKYS